MDTTARVILWGDYVGAVTWQDERGWAVFEFEPTFLRTGRDVAPMTMPIAIGGTFTFPGLARATYLGLPGLLADVLPDKFGNAVIDAWLERNGRDAASFNPVERLCYVGSRGMGALEFEPSIEGGMKDSVPVEISSLVQLAQEVTDYRNGLKTTLEDRETGAMRDIIRVGTSAGGARPKAVIAMNGDGDVRSGQVPAPEGYTYWLIKFDGVDDLELGGPRGYGRIEYAYYLLAKGAKIVMTESKLLEEGGRAHFLTRRFDRRDDDGSKLHMLSLCGLAHYDFNQPGAYAYEQAFRAMRELRLSRAAAEQQFRRMVFNVVARNQDDHTKNIAYLMDEEGSWSLAPAFDVTYAHNPSGRWTNEHQMTVNGKRDGFDRADLLAVAETISLRDADEIIDEVVTAVGGWRGCAELAGVPADRIDEIERQHRMTI